MAQPDFLPDLPPVQEIPLEAGRVDGLGRRNPVQIKLYQGRGRILDRGEALVDISRREKPTQQILG